jgi:hypothetical protein
VADNDIYQRAVIGVSLVGSDRRLINAKLDKLFNFAEDLGLAEMIDTQLEIIPCDGRSFPARQRFGDRIECETIVVTRSFNRAERVGGQVQKVLAG